MMSVCFLGVVAMVTQVSSGQSTSAESMDPLQTVVGGSLVDDPNHHLWAVQSNDCLSLQSPLTDR